MYLLSREKSVNEWTMSQKQTILNILLNQARSNLNKKSLNVMSDVTILDEKNRSINLPSTTHMS